MELTGILKAKSEANQVSEKFKKRDFVITDNSSQYPQHISFQLTQDKCSLIDDVAVGAELKVHFNLRGREWTKPTGEVQYFNTLEAWRIEKLAAGSAPISTKSAEAKTGGAPASSSNNVVVSSSTFGADQEDDLPF